MNGQELADLIGIAWHGHPKEIRHIRIKRGRDMLHFVMVRVIFGTHDKRHFTAMNIACFDGNTHQVFKPTRWFNVREIHDLC